jgi:hypothetical protein
MGKRVEETETKREKLVETKKSRLEKNKEECVLMSVCVCVC